MRIFVCEFLTGGGLAGRPAPAALCREGDIMLRALAAELAEIRGIEVVVARDPRFGDPDLDVELRWIDPARDPWPAWRELIAQCDAAWPIAPESGGALAALTELIATSGRVLMGSGLDAVRLTSSKQATAAHLEQRRHPRRADARLSSRRSPVALPPSSEGWVVKPDDGAGRRGDLAAAHAGRARGRGRARAPIARASSSSPTCAAPRRACRCSAVAAARRCSPATGRTCASRAACSATAAASSGGAEARRAHYEPIAAGIAAAIPDLWGYVGVDLIDTADGPRVLEINARLTTSYAGLRDALGINTAGARRRLARAAGRRLDARRTRSASASSASTAMQPEPATGWDIGGAHLKVAQVDASGRVHTAAQIPCTLWLGMAHLHRAIEEALAGAAGRRGGTASR